MTHEPLDSPASASSNVEIEKARGLVRAAVGRLERSERNALEEVREALCAFIAVLRARGAAYESAVETVRALVATPVTQEGAKNLFPAAREALVELSTHWCAAEYARDTERDQNATA